MLRVKKASISDEGTFTCVAENRVGKLEASATLTVRGKTLLLCLPAVKPSTQQQCMQTPRSAGVLALTPAGGLNWQFSLQGFLYANEDAAHRLSEPTEMFTVYESV